MPPTADAEYFNFRLHDLDWREYWLNYFVVLRTHYFKVYILKLEQHNKRSLILDQLLCEISNSCTLYKPETVEASRRRLDRMKFVYKAVKGVFAFAFLALVVNSIVTINVG